MPTEALGRYQMLAGIPAGLGSLQNLLAVAVDPNPDKQNLIDAFETDPALLLAALAISREAAGDLANWHQHLDAPILQAAALTLAGHANTGMLASGEGHWQRAMRQSLIADELARKVPGADPETSRLAALLAGLTDAAPDIVHDLASLGCSHLVCDVVRYHRESRQELAGTASVLRVVATAHRLLNTLGNPDPLAEELVAWVEEMLGLDHDTAYEGIGIASWRYEQAMRNVRKVDTAQAVADSHAAALFYRALQKSQPDDDFLTKVSNSAHYLFGCSGIYHFEVTPDHQSLVTQIDGEKVSVSIEDTRSAIASAYRGGALVSSTEDHATLIEQQLLTRLGGRAFYCVPLGGEAGLLFMALDLPRTVHLKGAGHVLVSAFADAVTDFYSRLHQGGDHAGAVSLDHLKARTREIIHEVNNPLAIVQNYLKTMAIKLDAKSGTDLAVQKEIDTISTELMRVSTLLQKFARIGDEDTLTYSDTDINQLIVELTGLVAADRQITVELQLDESIPVLELAGDALRQVLLNIVKNAAEAMDETSSPQVFVSTQGAVNLGGRHYLEIVIADNGPGMSAAQRLELFNSEAGASVSTKGQGRGLGLGIAKGLLDEMGGLISVRDAQVVTAANGKSPGTSFQILVPFEALQIERGKT